MKKRLWWLLGGALVVLVAAGVISVVVLSRSFSHTIHRPKVHVVNGELVTPSQRYSLQVKSGDSECWGWPLLITGVGANIGVEFSALPSCAFLRIGTPTAVTYQGTERFVFSPRAGIEVNLQESYYRLNTQPTEPLEIEARPRHPNSTIFAVTPPLPLRQFPMKLIGGGLYPNVVDAMQRHEADRHTLRVAFTVDGQPHHLHVEFELEAEAVRAFGVPGMP